MTKSERSKGPNSLLSALNWIGVFYRAGRSGLLTIITDW